MKKSLQLISFILISVLLILSGCSKNSTITPTTEGMTTPLSTDETLIPTPTEEPIVPCNIVFESDRQGNLEIYSMAPDGSNQHNLSNNPANDSMPVWSPDGSQIAFVSNRKTDSDSGQFIYTMKADGSDATQVSHQADSNFPDWSPLDSQIAYSSGGDVYLIDLVAGTEINLTNSPENDEQPKFSLEGHQIAWLKDVDNHRQLFTMDLDGGNVFQVTNGGDVTDAEWTVDGRLFIHWSQPDGICNNCVITVDGSDVIDAGGKGTIQEFLPFWTVEGDRVELVSADIAGNGREDILLVSEIYPDIFKYLTSDSGNNRNPDAPAKCGPVPTALPTAVAATAAPQPLDNSMIQLGYAGDDPAQSQRKVDFQRACEELGIQCTFGTIPELLEKNVSAIVQNSNPEQADQDAALLQSAVDHGIPVIILDAEIDLPNTYSILADREKMVATTLEYMFSKIDYTGDFAFFDFVSNGSDTKIINGLIEKQYPNIRVIASDPARYDFLNQPYSAGELLNDHPSIKAIWTNAAWTNLVLDVADSANSPGFWPVINCEATKSGLLIWRDRPSDLQCIAVSTPPGIAYDAAYAAYYLARGEKINPAALGGQFGNALYVDFPVVTNENLSEVIEKIQYESDDFIVDKVMAPEEIKGNWFIK